MQHVLPMLYGSDRVVFCLSWSSFHLDGKACPGCQHESFTGPRTRFCPRKLDAFLSGGRPFMTCSTYKATHHNSATVRHEGEDEKVSRHVGYGNILEM